MMTSQNNKILQVKTLSLHNKLNYTKSLDFNKSYHTKVIYIINNTYYYVLSFLLVLFLVLIILISVVLCEDEELFYDILKDILQKIKDNYLLFMEGEGESQDEGSDIVRITHPSGTNINEDSIISNPDTASSAIGPEFPHGTSTNTSDEVNREFIEILMEEKRKEAIEYAKDNNLSVEEAFKELNTKDFESDRPGHQNLDPNTVRDDISHKQCRKLTCNTEAIR